MKSMTASFTSSVEDKIGNYHHPSFDETKLESNYYHAFGDTLDADNNTVIAYLIGLFVDN